MILQQINQRNLSIDIGRFIAAFLVVCLHTSFPSSIFKLIVSDLGKIAVPFFLMVSGFYIYSQDNTVMLKRITNSIKKVGIIILQASVVYGILRFVKHFYLGIDISAQNFKLIPFLLLNDFQFTEHLWYLFAFFYVLIISKLFIRFKLLNLLLYSIPLFFIINFVFTIWSRVVPISEGKFWYELNWLVVGMPYFVLGLLIKKYFNYFSQIDKSYLLSLIVVMSFTIFPEHFAFKQFVERGPGVFSTAILAVASFLYCARDLTIFTGKMEVVVSQLGSRHALNIYLYHVLIREVLSLSTKSLFLNNSLSIFIISLLLSISSDKLKAYVFNKKVIQDNLT
jgi:surface polysaccharide O-acyltransferase-like enzyme